MKTISVSFTDDEFAVIENVVGFVNRTSWQTIDGEIGPSEWVHDVIANRLGILRYRIVSSDRTSSKPMGGHAE